MARHLHRMAGAAHVTRVVSLGLTGAAVLSVIAMPSAAASRSYSIAGGGAFGATVTETAFVQQHCPADFPSSPLQGVDAAVIAMAGVPAGQPVTVGYGTPVPAAVGGLQATWYSPGCAQIGNFIANSGIQNGAWGLTAPANAAWLVIASSGKAAVTLTVTP